VSLTSRLSRLYRKDATEAPKRTMVELMDPSSGEKAYTIELNEE